MNQQQINTQVADTLEIATKTLEHFEAAMRAVGADLMQLNRRLARLEAEFEAHMEGHV